MKIAFNPSTVAALTSPPNNKDITFDLRGQNIFARGVKFYGTDTWRPVVDNLTSNSATSSLSANQGRVLAGLINGKSDSDHNHDGRYLKLTGGTLTGNLIGTSAMFSGRFYGNGDDEGIIIKPSSNGYAGLILGTHDGERSIFYFVKNKPFWRYSHGSDNLDIIHPKKSGTIALISDIPNKNSWNYDDRYLKLTGGTMLLGEGLKFHANDNYFGTNADARIISLLDDNDKICDGGLIIDERATLDGKEYVTELLRIRDSEFKWRGADILHSGNYSSILDSRYYTESEVNSLLSKKLDRVNLSVGGWNPRGYNLAADYFYNGGDLSISESGGQIHVSVDGYFWQNEGRYRVLDTSDVAGLKDNLTVHQYLSNTDTTWWPLIWGGSSHASTSDSTGAVYKSHDKLSWQTSSQTLYATNLYTGRLETLNNHYYRFNSDATLRIYGSPHDTASERIYFQAGIDNRIDDYDIPSYGGEQRHSIILNPRGGFVGIGDTNPTYKLSVGGSIGTEGNIYISHATNNNMNHDTSNPRIVFSESGSQAVGLVYTDYDSYRASKGLKVMDVDNDDPGNVWFEVQGYNYSSGYVKNGSNDNYVLLGGGGHKAESSLRVAYASNADMVDGYHASGLWRSDGGTWNPNANISLTASGNNQEWSFDIYRNGHTGCYWHVWDNALGTLLKVNADNGKVYAPYNFVGNLEGNANTANSANSATNADTVDSWHKDEINRTLFITSDTSGLSSYWAKLWEINLNNQYNDVTITFLAAASYYPSYFAIFSVYLRQNGTGTTKSISARILELIGNIAVGDTDLRLYVNNTTGNCQLWGNVKGQYGTLNLSVLKKAWRTANDSSNIGTFFSTKFSSVQSLPGDGWNKIGVTQQVLTGTFNPSSHTHTWTSITDKLVAGNEFNIVNAGFKEDLWFNYLPINDRSKSATISAYCFGNGNKGYTAVRASGFIKNGGNENQLLRADGGVAAFNWSGQSGQPAWLWGGNDFNSYYVYNPSNFRVAYAASAGNAETLGGFPKNYSQAPFGTIPCIGNDGVMEIGRYIDYHYDNSGKYDFSTRLQASGNNKNVVTLPSASGTLVLTSDILNYYWANVKISTSSSTTTSPTVSSLTATSSIRMGNILLEYADEINNITNDGSLNLNCRNSGNVSLCAGGGKVGIGTRYPSHELYVMGYTHTKGFGINPYYLSDSGLLPTISPGDGYTYRCLEIGSPTKISCIIADKTYLPGSTRGVLLNFKEGFDGQLVLLKDLQNYGSGNGYFWVMPSGCKIIKADGSSILIGQNQISNTYDDGRSRFFIYSSKYSAWIEFLCANIN